MLDLKLVQKEPERVRAGLARRKSPVDVDLFLDLDAKRRAALTEVEALKAERNQVSGAVAKAKRAGENADALMARSVEIGGLIKELDAKAAGLDAEVQDWLLTCPNLPHESTPDGASEADNPVLRVVGEPTRFDFTPKEHGDIGAGLGLLDFERAAKLSGARFAVSYGDLAKLERALIAFMLDLHAAEHGRTEVATPVLATSETLTGTGQLPKFKDDLFRIADRDLWLIPTAEVTVTNLHAGETLAEAELPKGYVCHTLCFRSEAGSYGRDVKGLIRQHQFNKVELVSFTRPEDSYAELERLTGQAEEVLKRLGLPYRVIALCTGDLGFGSAKTYDLEVWLPGQNAYREISSCSNFEDFQARRAGIKFKRTGEKKAEFVHTLNGSGLAVGRTLVAILENFQEADGSVRIPEALQGYMGRDRIEPCG